MVSRKTLDAITARRLFEYDPATGVLRWAASRPRSDFATSRGWKVWTAQFAGHTAGGCNSAGYTQISYEGTQNFAHRVVWLIAYGEWPEHIDHINGVKDDNRLHNLRAVTHQENHKNAARKRNNTSGHTGVTWDRPRNRWRAQITVSGRNVHLGRFADKTAAIAVRKSAEITHGFHANHGKPAATRAAS